MQIIYTPTGQRIVFRGADNPKKMKSINLGKGYVKYAWFEELDQFASMDEIRNILQSLFRGGDEKRISFYSYNPPKSGRSWVNQEARRPSLAGGFTTVIIWVCRRNGWESGFWPMRRTWRKSMKRPTGMSI
ncbi:MAG: phage terminase large subunit [Candidatus Syntrophopropionicum ammoniitolerans]